MSKKIKELRLSKGLTQKQFGAKIGRSIESVKKYESGEVSPPWIVLEKIAGVLGVTVNNLITDEEMVVFGGQISNIAALKDVENLVENFPEYEEIILDITKGAYKIVYAEFLRLPDLTTYESIFEIIKNNLNLYSELFQTIYEISNVGFIMIEAKKENIPKLYSRKNEKIRKINDILEEIFSNHIKRHGLDK